MTIDQLAEQVSADIRSLNNLMTDVKDSLEREIQEVKDSLEREMRQGFAHINARFDAQAARLDRRLPQKWGER